jgi:hypothetical protein
MTHLKFCPLFLLWIFGVFASTVFANSDLDRAYLLFQKRDKDIENIESAKRIYEKVIKDSHAPIQERTQALDKYGRLAAFQGEVGREIYAVQSKDASSIFNDCIKMSDHLSPNKIGVSTPEYTYWRALCIGLWAANTNSIKVMAKFHRVTDLKSLIKLGQQNFRDFDNFGFNRMEAGIHVRSKGFDPLKLYDPAMALNLIDKNLAMGTDSYFNYILKAEALIALGRTHEAKTCLQFGVDELMHRFAKSNIPVDSIPENKVFLERMKRLYRTIN